MTLALDTTALVAATSTAPSGPSSSTPWPPTTTGARRLAALTEALVLVERLGEPAPGDRGSARRCCDDWERDHGRAGRPALPGPRRRARPRPSAAHGRRAPPRRRRPAPPARSLSRTLDAHQLAVAEALGFTVVVPGQPLTRYFAAARCWRSKNASKSVITLCRCPNSSKLTRPKSWVHTAKARCGPGRARRGPTSRAAPRGRRAPPVTGGARDLARSCRRRTRRQRCRGTPGRPTRGVDRGRRGRVTGHGAAIDQRVLVGVGDRPRAHGAGEVEPSRGDVRPAVGGRPFGRHTDRVVRLDDQRGEQLVTAGEVAVDRRGSHLQLTGDRPQRQRRGPLFGEVPSGDLEDAGGQLDPSALAGGAGGGCLRRRHAPHHARIRER